MTIVCDEGMHGRIFCLDLYKAGAVAMESTTVDRGGGG